MSDETILELAARQAFMFRDRRPLADPTHHYVMQSLEAIARHAGWNPNPPPPDLRGYLPGEGG